MLILLGLFAYCGNHLDEYLNPDATYEDLLEYSENIFNAASTLAIAKAGYTALKGKTGKFARVENVADGVVKAEYDINETVYPIGEACRKNLLVLMTLTESFYCFTDGLLLFLGDSVDEMLDCIVGECRKPIEIE